MALRVSDVLGLDRLRALRAEGKDNAAILEEVNAILDPIKKNIGEDVYTSFSDRGISFSKMKEYSDYQAQLAVEAAKAAEDKAYADDVAFAKDTFKKEYSGTGFKDRLDRGVGRVITELNVAAHNLVGAKPDPQRVGFLQADDEIAAAYEDAHRTAEEKKIYKEKEQAFADANGTVDTITTGADMLWQKVKNPNEWDMAGLMADFANPVNLAGGGAGALATKALENTAIKMGTKVAVGTGTSAAVDGGLGYGYDYNVQKGRGRSDEEATKAATLGLAANVTMGAGTGALTSLLTSRLGKTAPKDVAPTDTADKTFSMMDGTVISKNELDLMGADEALKTLEQKEVAIPDDIKNSALLKVVNESEDHSAKAMEVIKTIDGTTTNTAEREAKVAKYAPPTEVETYVNKALNDGEVAPSMYGSRARNKLEVSIENADNISMEQVNAKLDEYGIVGEHKAVILDAYARRDIGYYDDWATSKIQQKGDADARANAGDGRKDTTVKTDRTDTIDAGVRETVDPNALPKTVPEPKAGDRENTGTTGRNTGDVDQKTGVPKTDKTVDGQSTVTDDGGTLPRDRGNNLVQNENGVLVDGEVASTPLKNPIDVKDIKTRNQLLEHRYYDDVVSMIKAEKEAEVQRVKRISPSDKILELEKLGWDKSEDRYKVEMQKLFKGNKEIPPKNFHTYTKKEMRLIESGKIDRPLAVKLKQDLQEYAANPLFKMQREEIDSGTHFFADEIELLKQLELDEVLNLVESDNFKRGFDEPMGVDDVVKVLDDHLAGVGKMVEDEVTKGIDALYGKETHIKLSQAQVKAIESIKDPMKRTVKRRKFEHKELKNRLKRAKTGKNKGAITKAQNNLNAFEAEFMRDGKIKKMGEC